MIQKRTKKFGGKHLAIVITAAFLALLIAAYLIITALLPEIASEQGGETVNPPEVIDGEVAMGNLAAVYPYIKPESIIAVQVDKLLEDEDTGETRKDSYMMYKPKNEKDERIDHFIFSYVDPDTEEKKVYYPDILYEDANIDYTDLYAIEQSNTLGVRKIDYLCAAIGALYFDERIPLSRDLGERETQLHRYGLSEEERDTIFLTYKDENGAEKVHVIFIGNKLITGVGYYFMLNGRDYVYTSTSSENLSYALSGFENFISSRIIAAEVSGDNGSAPYHTNKYSQWISKYYTVAPGSTDILTVPSGVEVVINANYTQPIYADLTGESSSVLGFGTGYRYSGFDKLTLSSTGNLKKLVAALTGKNVGAFDSNMLFTLITDMNSASLYNEENGTGVYEYEIYKIEAIVTDSGDITEVGAAIPEGSKIKIEYSYTIDGKRICSENSHAVIDLSSSSVIDDATKEALRNAGVGTLSAPLPFTAKYTEDNTAKRQIRCVISEISLILEPNAEGTSIVQGEKVTENSIVNIEYYYMLDGEQMGEGDKRTIILSEITEDSSDYALKKALIGKTMDDRMFSTDTTVYCQPFMDFRSYEISGIEGYIALEQTVSFGFVPEKYRDAFYAESIYTNTLPKTNKYSAYAMNDEACDAVLRILGGIATDTNSTGAQGLVGTETVAVGLTHSVLEKYKLYDGYRIFFELPRGLSSGTTDYTWLDRIGFTLYIGTEIQADGTIFVASDLYDTVVKIDPSTFEFLKFSFPEYWARRNLALVDVADIENISVKFNYSDLYGEYMFDFDHTTLYISNGSAYYTKPEGVPSTEYDLVTVTVRSLSDRRTDTLFSRLINNASTSSEKVDFFGLAGIYNVAGGGDPSKDIKEGNDTLGTASMKEMLRLIYSTYYLGVLDKDAQAKASEENKLMEMTFDLGENSEDTFRYEFYRVEDRRIMVSLYRVDSNGNASTPVSDLYITDFAFKKIVNNFTNLLNGVPIDADAAY